MKYSQLFGKTVREAPSDATMVSHKLLYQAGYIRESTAGRYYFLPLGWRVHDKIKSIIKAEMDKVGAQEMIAPVLHPLDLWKETNRTNTAGFELMRIKDARDFEFALGGTAEEMFVDLVRRFKLSYRDLPLHLYQFSTKFRDEKRARGGLLRVREFVMKDAYSFDKTEAEFKVVYEQMAKTYYQIFLKLGLNTVKVESDNGYIGGEYCHEFVVESPIGETTYLTTIDGSYAAHIDVAKFSKFSEKSDEKLLPRKDVEGIGVIGVQALADFLHIPVEKTTKTIIFETDGGNVVAAAVNGLYDVNEAKLKNILHVSSFKLASPEVVKQVTGAEVGYAGILNLPKSVKVILDESVAGRVNFECGANKTHYHSININFGRDLSQPEKFYDIATAKAGYESLTKHLPLIEKRGIEVGNIFQLGYHYTNLMKGANFIDADGSQKPYYMGCYGIGLGRSMAAVVEVSHDNKGIIWPESIAPFQVQLISLPGAEEKGAAIYELLDNQGIEVLWDDRDVSAGVKFGDADLIGIPYRLVVSQKTGDKIEFKKRSEKETVLLSQSDLLNKLHK
jgi:prolyl-tRNA synthetase